MGPLAVGDVALVSFPFSDLSGSKLRPALALAEAGRGDWLLCQITSNPYADPMAIALGEAQFSSGSLRRTSYVRPGKLFTAHQNIVARVVGRLKPEPHKQVVRSIQNLLEQAPPP